MPASAVKKYLDQFQLGDRVQTLPESTATVAEATKIIGCEEQQIAKTLSFLVDDTPVLIVTTGNTKIDNKKFKGFFHSKAKMIPKELVQDYIGHDLGGVCPFAVKPQVKIYLDESLKGNDTVYPGAGDEHNVVKLSLAELEKTIDFENWVDVCKFYE